MVVKPKIKRIATTTFNVIRNFLLKKKNWLNKKTLKTILHKRFLITIVMIFAAAFATAQESYVVLKNSTSAFYVKNTTANSYHWAVYNTDNLNMELTDASTFEFVSVPDSHRVEIKWHKAGEYILTVAEFNPCQNLKFVTVKVKNTDFEVVFDGKTVICSGQTLTLIPKISKPGVYSYLWSDGSSGATLDVQEAGTYSVTVTDINTGAKATASVTVTESETPQVNLGEDYVLAEGEEIILDAQNEGCTYQWTTGATSQTIKVNRGGTYGVVVTNSAGCFAYDEIVVTDVNDIFTINLGEDKDICDGDNIVLNPQPSIKQEYSYLWSTGATTATLTVKESGVYSVVVRDKQGNERTDKVTVTVHSLPIVDLGDDIQLYNGETATLDAGNAGCKFEWNTGADTQTITVSEENVYSVLVTNKYGCSASDAVSVLVNNEKRFTVDLGGDRQICDGDKIYIEPNIDRKFDTAPTYRWLPNEAETKGIFVYKSGKYCVEVTANGATEQDCMTLTVNPNPEVDLGDDKFLKAGETIDLDAGNPGAFYEWSTGDITQTISVEKAGVYSVTVTSPKGCSSTDEVAVNYPEGEHFVGIPSAFSPNGDGKNDVLYVRGNNVAALKLIIYNRLGIKVFQSNRMEVGWDGTYKGVKQDMDAYVYLLDVTFLDGTSIKKSGNVTLLE